MTIRSSIQLAIRARGSIVIQTVAGIPGNALIDDQGHPVLDDQGRFILVD